VGYFVVSPEGVVVAADQGPPVGKALTGYRKEIFDQAIAGKPLVSKPFRSPLLLANEKGELRADLPTMFTAGPLCDEKGKPIAALGLRIRPEDNFTRILQTVRFGKSGETYAFDAASWWAAQGESLRRAERPIAATADQAAALQGSAPDATVSFESGTRKCECPSPRLRHQ
jgi:hypothetical protein